LRNAVGQQSLDEVLAQTEKINASIRQILDTTAVEQGVEVTLVELKDIQLPDSMKRTMAVRLKQSAKSERKSLQQKAKREPPPLLSCPADERHWRTHGFLTRELVAAKPNQQVGGLPHESFVPDAALH
jgi:SPFH domain / Band 7 family